MFRGKLIAILAALVLFGDSARAGFTLIGPSFNGVTVDSSGTTMQATGFVSSTNFVSWNLASPDSTPIANNILTNVLTPSGNPAIAAVRLVSNSSTNPTLLSPTPLPTGTNTLERLTNINASGPGYNSFSGEFSANESVLTAVASNSALIIDFAVPVSAAGFRVQADIPGTNNTFFLQGFNQTGSDYSPVTPLYNGLQVTTASYSGSEAAPFYGIQGTTPSDTFTRLWIGFTTLPSNFEISTLEFVTQSSPPSGGAGAVPAPPTFFAAAIGLAGLRWLRRRKT